MVRRYLSRVLTLTSAIYLALLLSGCGSSDEDDTRRRLIEWCVLLERATETARPGAVDFALWSPGKQLSIAALLKTLTVPFNRPTTDAWGRDLMLEVTEVRRTDLGVIVQCRMYSLGRLVDSPSDDIVENLLLSSAQFMSVPGRAAAVDSPKAD